MFLSLSLANCFDHFSMQQVVFDKYFPAFEVTLFPKQNCSFLQYSLVEFHINYGNESRMFYRYHFFSDKTITFHCLGSIPLVSERFCFNQMKLLPKKMFIYIEAVDEMVFQPENWDEFSVVFAISGSVFAVGLVVFVAMIFVVKSKERKPMFDEGSTDG
ncbi:Hypothetical_protein [Hexamita inflata]|uniref:Hypothetical_protein n=1 Tax=Hexamita inflata TaxID=28002 RepID=A0ABP1HEA1_9EUKA